MKHIIEAAQMLHKRETGETITIVAIAATLWPDSQEKTRANSMSKGLKDGINRRELIFKLSELFPETLLEAFINYDSAQKYLTQLENRYSVDYFSSNEALAQLYKDLKDGMTPKKSLHFWLNY